MYELALFAGAGGGIIGGKLLGWRTVCAVEYDAYARAVLAARQNDGCLDPFPIWDDVRTFTKRNNAVRRVIRQLRRIRHSLVISGGFPCQDISCAGKGAGLDGARSGLWAEFARIIREIRPAHVLVENSPMLTSRGLGRVLGDLAAMGYDARWGVLGAVHAGAPHRRLRIWIRAELSNPDRKQRRECGRVRGDCRETSTPSNGRAFRNIACFRGEGLADTDCNARDQWRSRDAAQGVGGRDTDRSRERTDDMADTTGTGCEAEWPAAQQRGGDARASGDVPGGDSRERERDDPNTLLDGLEGLHEGRTTTRTTYGPSAGNHPGWWGTEPELGRVANELAGGMDGLNQGSET